MLDLAGPATGEVEKPRTSAIGPPYLLKNVVLSYSADLTNSKRGRGGMTCFALTGLSCGKV